MSLWTYQFNLDEAEIRKEDDSVVKKYVFSSFITGQLIVDRATFKSETCKKELTRLNKTWDLSKMDLLFFPIVREQHWVVTCINIFLKQINFFNSINGSTITPCYEASNNLVANFSKAALELQIFKEDVSQFVHKYPTEFPHQHTLNDCGVYSMLYIESWNGKKMDVACESSMIGDYRKYAMGGLLLSPMNEVNTSDFVEKHCVQD